MEKLSAVCLLIAASAFAVQAWRKRSWLWLGVALLVTGVYAVPVAFVAFR